MIKKVSLKKEILQLLIIFSIIVIVLIGSLSIINQYSTKIETTEHNQKLVLKQVRKEVEKLINSIENISVYITRNYQTNKNLLKNIVETNKNISSILILNKKGIIEDFYAISNLNIHKGFDYSRKEYFKKLTNQNTYWSSVFLSTVDESASISFSFKMNGKIGVFMINLSELSDFMLRFKNSDNTHMIRIFDSSGVMIINPDSKQLVLQRYNASTSEVFTQLINKEKEYTQKIFNSANTNKEQFGTYTKVDKTGWSIVIRESHDVILESLKKMIISFGLAILFFILVSLYISFKISNKIFKSFDDMQLITSNIAAGNYEVQLKDLYYDEFNRLLNSFNKMQNEIDKREDTLEKSLESFKILFNSTMESIVLTKDEVIIDVNDITLTLFDAKSKDEFIGKNMMDFISSKSKELVKSNLDKDTSPYEVELVKFDDSRMQVFVQGKFLQLQNEKVRLTAIIDITELKQKDKLLFQQSKMASMGEMLGNIAHQWRQPLNVISTSASAVKFEKEFDTLSDERFIESMDMIVHNTQYLSKTIDDFRNFFKPDKSVEKFIPSQVVKQAIKLLDSTLKNHEIEVQLDFLDTEQHFEGYSNEFIQVIINIINNARDAFILNGIEHRVLHIEENNYNDKYVLTIKDNAGGIPLNIIDKIFDPYFTTKHKSQGTGIGLYMSHQIIVDHMKGDISVRNIQSRVDNKLQFGSCFSIKLNNNKEIFINYSI